MRQNADCRSTGACREYALWDWLEAHCDDEHDEPLPVFEQLREQIAAKYPSFDEFDEEDEDDCVWTDESLEDLADCVVPVLGIVSHEIDEVFPFVIATANALGLPVIDYQECTVHMPDGTKLSL